MTQEEAVDEQRVKLFRKKPVVIEAEQFRSDERDGTPNGVCFCINGPISGPHVHTLEGSMRVSDGDWIIKGLAGEFYPCKPDIFAATYEPADSPDSAAREAMAKAEAFEEAAEFCRLSAVAASCNSDSFAKKQALNERKLFLDKAAALRAAAKEAGR